jgi:aldehyde dehydrogenase (NAD+)
MLDAPSGRTLRGMYIDGRWVPAARSFADLNPNDGSLWAQAPDGSRADARAAIEAAHRAFPGWSALKFTERARLMHRIAEVFERRAPDFIAGVQAEGGGWYGKGAFEAHYVPEVFRSAAAVCYDSIGEVMPSRSSAPGTSPGS